MEDKYINIKEIAEAKGLRKTFGYHFYQEKKDIALLQTIFNHSTPTVTLRYIGINQDMIDSNLKSFSL